MQSTGNRKYRPRTRPGLKWRSAAAWSRAIRKQRRALAAAAVRAFGVSLAIETLLLGLLVAAPLLTSVAQPQFHQILPPQLTFFGAWREHNPAQHAARPTTARQTGDSESISANCASRHDRGHSIVWRSREMPRSRNCRRDMYREQSRALKEEGRLPPVGTSTHRTTDATRKTSREGERRRTGSATDLANRTAISASLCKRETKERCVLHAIISRDGRITALEVVSGHPFLVQAALDAVRQWRYRPTLLNGEPVEVETSITVMFRLQRVTRTRRAALKKGRRNRCFGPCISRRGSSSSAPGHKKRRNFLFPVSAV